MQVQVQDVVNVHGAIIGRVVYRPALGRFDAFTGDVHLGVYASLAEADAAVRNHVLRQQAG